jgi:hypothetical protein
MNVKMLRRVAAVLVLAPLAHSAIAEGLGEHPAVIVARTWSTREIDPNTFIVLHPASPHFVAASPAEKADKVAAGKQGARTPQARRGS